MASDEGMSRRSMMYLAATAVGGAAALKEMDIGGGGGSIIPTVGGGGGGSSQPSFSESTVVGDFEVTIASSVNDAEEAEVLPRVLFVTGMNGDLGTHVEYEDDLPIVSHPSGDSDQFELIIASSLGDVETPETDYAFIFIRGDTSNRGEYVYGGSTGLQTDGGEWQIREDLSSVPDATKTPQMNFITGIEQRGVWVDG